MKKQLNKIKTVLVVVLCLALTLLVAACSTTQYQLSYTAGTGGTITGEVTQTVDEGKDGSAVTAVANSGYVFVKWSDGLTTATRTDKNVQKDISVTAEFTVDTQGGGSGSGSGESGPGFVGDVVVSFEEGFVGSWVQTGGFSTGDDQITFSYQQKSGIYETDQRIKVSADGKVVLSEANYYTPQIYEGQSEFYSTNNYKVELAHSQNDYQNKVCYLLSRNDGYLYLADANYNGEYVEPTGYKVFSKISNDVSAETNDDGSEKASSFLYNVVDDEIEIFKYVGVNTDIKIPSQIDGKNVTKICKNAMAATIAEKVIIPSTIKTIEDGAFNYAQRTKNISFEQNSQLTHIGQKAFSFSAIEHITIPASVTYIGKEAFAHCYLIEDIVFEQNSQIETIDDYAFMYCTKTESIVLPKSLRTIGDHAFSIMQTLNQVTFEQNSQLQTIGANAFASCYTLKEFVIPSGVNKIGGMAFHGCRLTGIVIPSSVQEFGYNVFGDNLYKTIVYCQAESKPEGWHDLWYEGTGAFYWGAYTVADSQGLVFAIQGDNATVSEYKGTASNVVVPSTIEGKTVVAIGNRVFEGVETIDTVTMPDSIAGIGDFAFEHSSLKAIDIPAKVTVIGQFAFGYCEELESINIPQNSQLKTIGRFAIDCCTKLKAFVIPANVEYVGENAFFGSTEIRVYCQAPSQPTGWSAEWDRDSMSQLPVYWDVQQVVEKDGFVYAIHTNEASLAGYTSTENKNVSVPEAINDKPVTTIGKKAFAWYPFLKSVTLPSTIKTIDSSAFKYCQQLESINLPQNLQSIGDEAFYDCNVLANVVFPASLKSIGTAAYYSCDAIGSVVVPKTIEQMGANVFRNCYRISVFCEVTSLPAGWHSAWLTYSECYWYSENKPEVSYKYWHYVDGVPTLWVVS